jgi:uncharacterized membrane protein
MKAILGIFSFSLWAIALGSWPTAALAQATTPAPCTFLSQGNIAGFLPGGAATRATILQRTIRCLQASGKLQTSGAPDNGDNFITFDPPRSISTIPSGITPDGAIIGYFSNASGVQHGFLRTTIGTFVTLDPPGSVFTQPTSINSAGEITGSYCDTASCAPYHGFVLDRNGTFTTFDAPLASFGILPGLTNPGGPPPDINPAGEIAGTYLVSTPSSAEHGFLRASNGAFTTIDAPGSTSTEVLAINPSGVIVGDFSNSTTFLTGLGFVLTPDGSFTTIDVPGSCPGNTVPSGGINPRGAIVGTFADPTCSTVHGYLRAPNGALSIFDPPNSTYTSPFAINPAGLVTGYFVDAGGVFHGFLRSPDGAITTFDVPGSFGTAGFEINPAGVIIGSYFDANGALHGFARIP